MSGPGDGEDDPEETVLLPGGDAIPVHFGGELDLAAESAAPDLHGENLARHRINTRRISLTDDFLQALPKIQGKLVGVWGSRDATAGHNDAIERRRELFQQAQAGAEFHVLEGIGHWAMYEAPAAVNQILLGRGDQD